jgi:hypothetical protein
MYYLCSPHSPLRWVLSSTHFTHEKN